MSGSHQKPPKRVFVSMTIVLFFLTFSAADSVGFVPCYVDDTCKDAVALSALPQLGNDVVSNVQIESETVLAVVPERMIISEVDIDLPVQNPETRDIALLDEFLKKGPVRYVDSARLGEKGNVLIFAHTSHLPVVKNQMYKAFNRVPELEAGDTITIQGEGKSYLYTVRSIEKVDVAQGIVDLSPTQGHKLTLVTCDTLTGKSARFILEAELVAVI